MAAATAERIEEHQSEPTPFVVVGMGPVGMRALRHLTDVDPDRPVVIYGDEPWQPYDRVRLTALLTGELKPSELTNEPELLGSESVTAHVNCRIAHIDPARHEVVDGLGRRQAYHKLLLATGSRPFIPPLPGVELRGVYTFRDLSDAQALVARRARSQNTVVLGGGLLGIEAARAMQRLNTDVAIVEHNAHLMFRQLDPAAGDLLHLELERSGLRIHLQESIRMVLGTHSVEGLLLASGREIPCDTLVLATGIRPNIDLARDAGLAYGRGIRVDDAMRTSDPRIFAVGECCEVRGDVYGLVAPGFEQASIAAKGMLDETGRYDGTVLATSLKVAGLSVFSMGETDPTHISFESRTYRDGKAYRRINTARGRVVGIVAMGDWSELGRLREHVKRGHYLPLWALRRFERSGLVWPADAEQGVAAWPAEAIVCSCNAVSKGRVCAAVRAGRRSLTDVGLETRAGTTCGSCRPTLAELIGGSAHVPAVRGASPLLWGAVFSTLVAALALFGPSVPYLDSVQTLPRYDLVWTDGWLKELSGYAIVVPALLTAVLSLRKRVPRLRLGDFDLWRLAHVALGGVSLVALWAHTGFRLGSHLNMWLMLCFSTLVGMGGVAAGAIARADQIDPRLAIRLREASVWLHILLSWPLPALLGLHVWKAYYF